MRYIGGMDERGNPIDVRDPLAARLRALSDAATDPAGTVATLLDVTEIFPAGLAAREDFRDSLTDAYARLARDGARVAVERLVP
jgi:fructuronate reductase